MPEWAALARAVRELAGVPRSALADLLPERAVPIGIGYAITKGDDRG